MNTKSIHKAIAVLPFINMSTNKDNEFFSDGITEEIINALGKIGSLKVTSRTSSFFFKGKNMAIPEIGKALNVSTIIEGSVRLAGDSIRITAQLIQAEEDFHFWSETWDRKLENIFEIQDEISLLIADKLREHFGHLEISDHLVDKQTENILAYEQCLKAKYYENKWNPEDVKTAISHYENALELDVNYSEAHLGLASCYSFLGTTAFMPFEDAWGKTIQYTQQALALNDQLSGVHYQLSNQAFFIECNYNKSLAEMKRAIALNPNNAEAQQFISFLYSISDQKTKSNYHLEIALSINPLSEETHFFRAYHHYMVNEYSKSLELLNSCLATNDKNIPAHSVKTLCLLKLGRYDDVLNYFDSIPQDVVIPGEKTGAIALAYALKGDTVRTTEYLALLEDMAIAPNGFTADSYLFLMYVITKQYDKAFNWAELAILNKSSLLLLRYTDPICNTLREDPRFEPLMTQIYSVDEIITKSNKKKNLLDKDTVIDYKNKLLNHLTEQKSYLETNLTLRILAEKIQIHPNQLSWLLNEDIGQNFNSFINKYRIEAFKLNVKNPKHSHLTIEGLAHESGFNSKTVFNTYFKKETGLTPKQFIKQL